jgi:hypothetical protein
VNVHLGTHVGHDSTLGPRRPASVRFVTRPRTSASIARQRAQSRRPEISAMCDLTNPNRGPDNVEAWQADETPSLSHHEWRERWLSRLDPGIAPYVDALRAAGVETFESCEGAPGHAYTEPTVRFSGDRSEGLRALAVALRLQLPVEAVRRYWAVIDGELSGPNWEMTFYRRAD